MTVSSGSYPTYFKAGANLLLVRVHNEYGVAMGMNRHQQQSFIAVHGAQQRMRRQPGAKIFGTAFDEADGLVPALQEVPECIRQRGKTPYRADDFR